MDQPDETLYYVYVLQCNDGSLYTGITTDLERRIWEHNNSPKGAKYTRARRPVSLCFSKQCTDKSQALQEECRIKKLPRHKKLDLTT